MHLHILALPHMLWINWAKCFLTSFTMLQWLQWNWANTHGKIGCKGWLLAFIHHWGQCLAFLSPSLFSSQWTPYDCCPKLSPDGMGQIPWFVLQCHQNCMQSGPRTPWWLAAAPPPIPWRTYAFWPPFLLLPPTHCWPLNPCNSWKSTLMTFLL